METPETTQKYPEGVALSTPILNNYSHIIQWSETLTQIGLTCLSTGQIRELADKHEVFAARLRSISQQLEDAAANQKGD